ncbi:SDR family NAD(P)-dependent oxidoreductase [Halieaceae bacterium IMCC14734]|uniref:SDR family NAD(P)-dependent oxidoreductase n=1 Tax=Candidatus Litorirhabdus singularis TaxID=2518993 RepID=A0ABT3THF8_9GAMM|nr:SDR family NAD(P)-dependent oxidoreductase [Candidatus Litorirhabdus singularis]MCX2981762.1 SDR family NAD(P)-dependent oxidoreductase [Candidatus Litorirhabdus singularis]
MSEFCSRYGPWALIAGGAQGIGEAYSRYAAGQGLNVIVLDFDATALARIESELTNEFDVECLPVEIDLGSASMLANVISAVAEREVGLLVYNAGLADVGPFFKTDTGLDFELQRIAVNVTGPLVLTHHFAAPMLARKRGGIILMSSGAGLKGAPYYAHYSATKAYDIALAEALWGEFKPYQVDVLAVAAGMTLSTAAKGYQHLDTSGFQTPQELVKEAMEAIGKQPLLVAGQQHRAGHEKMKKVPDEQLIGYLAKHAIDNFMDGKPPKQAI